MTISNVYLNLPVPFNFYRLILNSDHLHLGLWPEDTTSMSMEEAQENMFNYLLLFFPTPPAEVLDVGCGLGLSSSYLSQKGYRVTAIAPSHELIDYAKQKYGASGADFKALDFFDIDEVVFSNKRYDVIFFQESAQYLSPLKDVFKKARELLKDKGAIVLGDKVCYDRSIKPETAIHLSSDFAIAFAENGFYITERHKIGKRVLPAYDLIITKFTEDFDRIVLERNKPDVKEKLIFYLNGWKKQKTWHKNSQIGYEMFVARKDNFFIKPYALGDEHRILPMFNEVFHVNRTIEHWYWKFRDNPYGFYKISEAFSEDDNLVAHYAGYPVPFYDEASDKGESFLSLQIGDTMTSPLVRHIGRGETSILSRTVRHFYAAFCDEKVPFNYGFITGKHRILGKKYLKYRYIDPVPFRIKNTKESPVQGASLLKKLFSGYKVNMVESLNNKWDEFFKRVCSSYRFLVKRDSQYLKWRYIDCPDKDYIFLSIYKRRILIGWSVFFKQENHLIWGDALFDRKFPDAVTFLLYYVLTNPICKDIEIIKGWFSKNPDWWNDILDNIGFRITEEPYNLSPGFATFTDPDALERLQKYFYYTMGDSDLF